jgi:hypothetical protein
MGQAIVYCSNCSAQLRSSDFEAKKAFKVEEHNFCAKCYHEIVGSEPPPPSRPPSFPPHTPLPTLVPTPKKPPSSTKMRIVLPQNNPHGTSRIAIPQQPPDPEGNVGLYVGLGIAALVLLIVAAAMSGGRGGERRAPPAPAPAPAPIVIPSPAPGVTPRESAAQQSLAKALRTENLDERRTLLVDAVAQAAGTSLFADAQRELDRVERKIAEVRAAAGAKTPVKRDPLAGIPAPPPPTPAPPSPPPPPPAPDRSREEAAALAKWEAALAPATAREHAAAIAALEKLGTAAPDVQLLKSVAALHQEALLALLRTPKGQKVALEYRDLAGQIRRADGTFGEEENGHVALRGDQATVEVEVGEILPSSLADLLRSRGGAVDPAAAAVYCLLEGDEAGARRLAGSATIPERFWAYGRNVAPADAARALYAEAFALASSYSTAVEAVPKYQSLLRDQAESPFVRRNKASITARSQQCARDFLFTSADMKGAGTFKAAKSARGFAGWTSDADSEPPKLKENFVELSFSALADTAYRCWVYAGGCCQETFEFGAQGTEMRVGKDKDLVEPGSGGAAPIKPYVSGLKKTHTGHTGPKQPSHWEWVAVPLPKYTKAGLQQLRLVTAQKGFSIAFACVSAARSAPPRELDMKELEKTRGAVPAASAGGGPRAVVLYSPALDGTDRQLVGEVRDKALYGVPLYGKCFAGKEGGEVFTLPAQGEVRVTYFLKTVTPLWVRIRVRRAEEKTEAYDAAIADPVAGRPTEARVPFSAFKPNAGNPFAPIAPGDVVSTVYFLGQDQNCGMRIDGFSIVELRNEAAVSASKVLFSENFDSGPGRFGEGEWADGGIRGTKAYLMPGKGISVWGAFAVPAKDSVTISFKVKPLQDVSQIQVLVWSDKLQDNGRITVDGFRKGEWKEVKFKATQLRIGAAGDGPPIDTVNNCKILPYGGTPDARVLIDDFEIRE